MKLFLAFSGEGTTDNRFIPTLVERVIQDYLIKKHVTAEFSWIIIAKKGSSQDNILRACKEVKDHHCVIFHRDAGNSTWDEAYENHFMAAVKVIEEDQASEYSKNLIPVIPVRETEAWMLVDKQLLKSKIETDLSDKELVLTYKVSTIENVGDPKRVIETAILKHYETLTSKQKRYAVKISDLYDAIASEVSIPDLDNLTSFSKMKDSLIKILDKILNQT
jgi:hypothetical protein